MAPTTLMTPIPTGTRTGETAFGPFTLRWTETGPTDGPVTLLLHGIYAGAHAYEWRELVPHLDGTIPGAGPARRVRVPDLLGAGRSDRPDLEFDASVVLGAVAALIEDAGPGCEIVASSLTGAYAVRAVADVRARDAAAADALRLVLITPTGLGDAMREPSGAVGRAIYALGRHTPLGDLTVAALTSAPSVSWFQRHQTYADPDVLTDAEVVETRRAGRLPNAKHLQLAFVTGRLALPLTADEIRAVRPLVLWARGQGFSSDADLAAWQRAGATVVVRDSGLPQVEEPQRVAEVLGR